MNLDFTNPTILKGAADAIRTHNYIHNRAEKNAVLITEYLNFAADLIDKFANGDVVIARHGQWIWFESEGTFIHLRKCSECENIKAQAETNFCPNCGADMRKVSEDGKS